MLFQSLIYKVSNVKCESTHLPHPLQLRLVAVDAGLEVETIQTPWFWETVTDTVSRDMKMVFVISIKTQEDGHDGHSH